MPVGYAVEPVQEQIGHPRERLDQGDARIGDVVIGPFRTALLDETLGVVDEILERAVVEVRRWKGHGHSSPGIE